MIIDGIILFGSLMSTLPLVAGCWPALVDLVKKKQKPIAQNSKEVELWTAADSRKEEEYYLANPLAFWLNPNRYDANGKYDLLADPYQPKPKGQNRTNLGYWYYISNNNTTASTTTYHIVR